MNGDITTVVTGSALGLEWAGGTGASVKADGVTRAKRHHDLIGTAQGLSLPIKGKGGFREQPLAVTHRPGFVVDRHRVIAVTHQFTGQVSSVNREFAEAELLAVQVDLNRIGNPGFGNIGRRHLDAGNQATVKVSQDMAFIAIDPLSAALAAMAHMRVFDRNAAVAGDSLF